MLAGYAVACHDGFPNPCCEVALIGAEFLSDLALFGLGAGITRITAIPAGPVGTAAACLRRHRGPITYGIGVIVEAALR